MNPKTLAYRRNNLALRSRVVRDLTTIWPALDVRRLDETFPDWLRLAAVVAGARRTEAADLAGDYLRAFRREAVVLPMRPLDPERFATSMRVTSVVNTKRALIAGKPLAQAHDASLAMTAGALTRLVLDAGRGVVMDSAVADPECTGWERVTAGGCSFCLMLASRGEVYSEQTADFASHDNCVCSAAPVYSDDSTGRAKEVRAYQKSARNISDADRARARKWMRDNL